MDAVLSGVSVYMNVVQAECAKMEAGPSLRTNDTVVIPYAIYKSVEHICHNATLCSRHDALRLPNTILCSRAPRKKI